MRVKNTRNGGGHKESADEEEAYAQYQYAMSWEIDKFSNNKTNFDEKTKNKIIK